MDAGKDTLGKLGGSVDTLNLTLADIRTQTLPRLNSGVDSLDGLVRDLRPTAQAITGLVGESTNTVKSLNLVVTHADALISDPELAKVAANLDMMSAGLGQAAIHVNGAAKNAEQALGYVRDDLTPRKQTFWAGIISEALSQAIGIPLKYLPTRTAVVSSVPVAVAK